MNNRILIALTLAVLMLWNAGKALATTTSAPAKVEAGTTLTEQQLKNTDIGKWFTASEIPAAVMERMKGKSYPKNCTVKPSELRYLRVLHHTFDGKTKVGEMVCNRRIATTLLTIFRQLYNANYPIERMVLIDNYGANDEASMTANNTTCFCFRPVAGSKKLSNHSRGMAVDINPLYNPCVKTRNGKTIIQPKVGKDYTNRAKKFNGKIDRNDLCYKLFTQHGFAWGGSWKTLKDYQHFEKNN